MITKHKVGEIIANRYQILEILGQGGSGFTYKAQDQTNQQKVALKVLSLSQLNDWKQEELFKREASILKELSHPCIPKYFGDFEIETDDDRLYYLVQQLAPGNSLASLIKKGWKPQEEEVKQIAHSVLDILVYLQTFNPPIIHRDIKPENLIYQTPAPSQHQENTLFLVDFGAVQTHRHFSTVARTIVGTYGYIAPEQLRGEADCSTDLYGLATTLLFLLAEKSPSELPQKDFKIQFRQKVQVSKPFANWLDKNLEPTQEKRFSSAQAAWQALPRNQTTNQEKTVSPVGKTLASLVGVSSLIIISFLLGTYLPELENSEEDAKQTSEETSTQTWDFPMSECGDDNPPGSHTFYPVFVNQVNESILNYLQSNYCRDAYLMTRESINQQALQVASFRSQERALKFVEILQSDSKIHSAEVGSPRLR